MYSGKENKSVLYSGKENKSLNDPSFVFMKKIDEEALNEFFNRIGEVVSVYWNHARKYSLHATRL